jgi:chromosome segregation ATPase
MQEEEKTVDIGDENEEAQEIDLDAPAPEQSLEEEIHVEKAEDNSQSADASQESSEQSAVQDSKQKDELGEYSESVQKRIAKLTRKMREAERQKEEAIQYAQTLKQQADKVKGQYDKLGTNYAKELEQKVTAGMAAAKAELRAATEAQDIDRQVEAQKAIAQMAMEETRLTQLKNYQDQQLQKAPQTQEQTVQQPTNAVPTTQELYQAAQEIDPKAQDWSARNPWFGTDNAMTYTAFDIHRQLVEDEGFDPQSNEYYSEVDKRIRLEFPHKFANNKESTAEQPVQTVASAKRPAAKGRRKTVKLTPSQIAISKRLGVPLEEYAKQLAAKEV